MNAFIESIRIALPEAVLDNDQLASEFPSRTAQKIYASTGIRERRVAAAGECAPDLAVRAASRLLEEEEPDQGNIDFVSGLLAAPDYFNLFILARPITSSWRNSETSLDGRRWRGSSRAWRTSDNTYRYSSRTTVINW